MYTISYKGYFIHAYIAHNDCTVQRPDHSILGHFKSELAAKQAITRSLKSE